MDVPKSPVERNRRRLRRAATVAVVVFGAGAVTLALSRLSPAAPAVDRSAVLIGTVRRGELVRQVRGAGTLVPELIRWVPAVAEARVERVLVQAGTEVRPESVLLELSNPELERDAVDAEWQVRAAEAELKGQGVRLRSELLDEKASAATVESEFHRAQLDAEAQEKMALDGLTSELDLRRARLRAREQETRQALEQERLAMATEVIEAQLEAQRARVEQLRALHRLRRNLLEGLRVRAGVAGILQQIPVEAGQSVAPGTNLARIAEAGGLKAQIRIAETQIPDVAVGQSVEIDTRNGVISGHVARIDPTSQSGTVTVDVALDGTLPRSARPDLSVEGTILLEKVSNVLSMGRPASARENATVGLFRLSPEGDSASRVPVRLGRGSALEFEVLDGLSEGDRVILSDMSVWDGTDHIRLR